MKLYRISENSELEQPNVTKFKRAAVVPGVACTECLSKWGNTGVIYPQLDEHVYSHPDIPKRPFPLPLEKFEKLAKSLEEISDMPILPGTHLGPLAGEITGELWDFLWINPWTPLMTKAVHKSLTDAGVIILVGKSALYSQNNSLLVEPYAPLKAHIKGHGNLSSCVGCGRLGLKKPDVITVERFSLDSQLHLFRLVEFPSVLLVSEEFRDFSIKQGYRNICFEAIIVE